MKKILVTGADGFIGSHLTEYLVRQGYEVTAFVQYNSFGSWGWLDHCADDVKGEFEVVAGDIRDHCCVKESMTNSDIVIHLAALVAIPYSYIAPHTYVDVNITGTLNVVQAAKELGVEKVVHTSTSEVYGTARYVPIDENHPLQGQSPYSASKIGADHVAMSFFHSFGTPVSIIRPFNTYGPRQSTRAVIPTVITQIASGARKIRLGALHPTRDFNFVLDTVRGFEAVMMAEQSIGETINIGSNFEISIHDTVNMISDIMDIEVEIETEQARLRPVLSEVDRLWACNKKAKDLTDWQPEYGSLTGMKNGLSETVKWFVEPHNLSMYKSGIYAV